MITYVQDLGQNQAKTTGTTTLAISFSGATKPVVGDLVVIYCSRDNVVTDPLTGDSFSDGTANSYTRIVAGSSVATAAGGVVGVMFYCVLTVAWATGTNSLTWTHPSMSTGNGARGMRAEHFTGATGLRSSGSTTGTSTTGAPSAANTTPVAGDLVCGMIASEDANGTAITADTDTTNSAWTAITQFGTTGSTAATNSKVGHQYKIVHTTGTQTYNPTTTSSDAVAIIATFQGPGYAGPDAARERATDSGTVLWHDGFDGTALSSYWISSTSSGSSVAVARSQVVLTTGSSGAYADYARAVTDTITPDDFEMHGMVTMDAGALTEWYPTIGFRSDITWSSGDLRITLGDYHIVWEMSDGAFPPALQISNGGSNGYLDTPSVESPMTAMQTSHRFRVRCEGSVISAKFWADGTVEPQQWSSQVRDYSWSGWNSRRIFMCALGGNTGRVCVLYIDYITVTALSFGGTRGTR